MKTLHIRIILISGIVIGVITIAYFTNYDFTPITKENTFGINALVIHRSPGLGCPTTDCHFPDYYLKINSKSKTFLLGYNICDENSCVGKDGLSVSLPMVDVLHPNYQELALPDNLPWKDGDSVDIKIKVPSSFIFDSAFTFDSSTVKKIWVDLGKSEIVRSS